MMCETTTTESFPTNYRSTCYGICVTMGRVTMCAASFASILIRANPVALPAAIATLNGLSAVAVWGLEETKDAPMPQSVEKMEEWKRRRTERREERGREKK